MLSGARMARGGAEQLVVARFEAQVRAGPTRLAVADDRHRLSYQELDARAGRLARWLAARGVGRDQVVGVHLERSCPYVVAMLAVTKAGAAYLPVDPAQPPARIGSMLADAGAGLVLCGTAHLGQLRGLSATPVPVDGPGPDGPEADPPGAPHPDDLAYVVYTSGSTGAPKGVMVSHGALRHLVEKVGSGYGFGPHDRVGLACSPSFDVSVSEVWLPLASGASIHAVPAEVLLSPEETVGWLAAHEITATVLPTPLAERALQVRWPPRLALHTLLTGGDRLHVWPAPELPFRLVNNYGPTENTVISTYTEVVRRPGGPALPAIGTPVPGTAVELLDGRLRPIAGREAGEIYLGGPQLARGYLGRPGLTADRFVAHPHPAVPGERLYRTGDLARRLPGGELEFVGRDDDQVQLRGQRVEPGEVTAALTSHPDVAAAYVTVHGEGEAARLVAYLAPRDPRKLPDPGALRDHLAARLPVAMVPATYVTLASLPLGPTGKVDRSALPEPEPPRSAGTPPRTPTERAVAQMWGEVLGVDRVGADDHLTDLGGHSLLATQVVARVNDRFGIDLPVGAVLRHPTVAAFAAVVDAAVAAGTVTAAPAGAAGVAAAPADAMASTALAGTAAAGTAPAGAAPAGTVPAGAVPAGLPPVRPGSGEADSPLSLAQQQVWFIERLTPDSTAYQAQATIRVTGRFEPEVFARALTELTRRHESLRTTYRERDGQPWQQVQPPAPYRLPRVDLSTVPAADRDRRLAEVVRAELARPFDLGTLPLQRWTAIRLGPHEHELLLMEHHLVHDGWSFAVLLRELTALYSAFAAGAPSPLPEPAVQLRDYLRWQRELLGTPLLQGQLDYWTGTLAGAGVLPLPTDHPRPAVQRHRGRVLRLELPAGLPARLRQRCRAAQVTPFTLMYAAFVALLHHYTGERDICVASGFANRRRPETEDLIGMLVNMVVLRCEVDGTTAFRELLARASQRVLAAAAHQECPFPLVVQALGLDRDLSRNPLAQVMFSAHDSPVRSPRFGEATGTVFERSNDSAKVDLNVVVIPRTDPGDDRVTLLWEYDRDLFEEPTMRAMAGAYLRLLAAAVDDPELPVGRLPVLDHQSARTVLVDWNPGAGRAVGRDAAPVSAQVAQWAARTPEALAVAEPGRRVSYRELWGRARTLAARLAKAGLGPGDLVAVCLPRSADLVVAELGVMLAGAAFVPVDPGNPDRRVRALLAGSGARVLVTSAALRDRLAATLAIVDVRGPSPAPRPELRPAPDDPAPDDPAPDDPAPDDLAYVMHTSGSTGQPKGVMIEHHGLTNLAAWHRHRLALRPGDRCTMVASPGFDFSVWECWPPLTAGASLHLPADESLLSPPDLQRWLRAEQVTVASFPTPLAAQLLALDWPDGGGPLRSLGAGGDRLTVRPAPGLGVEVVNLYGPTESSVVAISASVAPDRPGAGVPDIGTPLPGTTAYLLDTELSPVPAGVVAELYLGGDGLARGYLGRADLTADRFVPDPFAARPGARLYRTGDLARHRRDGSIEFVGRADEQVKIRGYRLEPAEVTAALRAHPGLRDAYVTAGTGAGATELVGYVVPAPGAPAPGPAELRAHLARLLPAPMLPAHYVVLAALPLTRHGKVDRRALPAPSRPAGDPGAAPPATSLERTFAAIWAEVLQLDQVGVDDSFFDLGGHSLLLGQVRQKLEGELGRDLPLVDLFAHPTIRSLARYLEQGAAPAASDGQGERLAAGRDRLRQRRARQAES